MRRSRYATSCTRTTSPITGTARIQEQDLPTAPTAADAEKKKVGAVWMHRTGAGIATLYELTTLGWTLRPLSETIIPQIAIGTGTYGELAGTRLLAKSVGAEKVVIGSFENLVQDPGGYSLGDFWSNTTRVQAGAGRNGGNGLAYERSSTALNAYNSTGTAIKDFGIPVVPGDRYKVSGWFKAATPNSGSTAVIQGHFYRADGSFITIAQNWAFAPAPAAETWYPISVERDAPADAAFLRFAISKVSSYTTGALTVSEPLVRSMTSGELLVDGAIAARHVATGTFQAVAATIAEAWIRSGHIVDLDVTKLVVTGTASMPEAVIEKLYTDVVKAKLLSVTEKIITRDIIATGAIGAAELSGDAINGKTITGAIIRTSVSSQRVQIDTNGIRCFNLVGQETARLAASSGGLLLTGELVSESAQIGSSVTLGYGEMKFASVGANRLTMTLNESGIRSFAAGTPLRIAQEAEGANSNIEISAGKNNSIDLLSRVRFLGDETRILWSGAWYMNENQTVALSELISEQHTGIVLAWSQYTSGSASNRTWNYGFVPKSHALMHPGTGLSIPISVGASRNDPVFKYVYVSDDRISGHASNSQAPRNTQVLRYVLGV